MAAAETISSPPHPALEELFRRHHEKVFRTAWRVTGNADDAEDVLQTVFLRLLRRDGGPRLTPPLGGYLHRAAVNAALDLVRKRRRRGDTALDGMEEVFPDPGQPGPERREDSRRLARDLRRALAGLPADQAEIFALRYFEGYANKEIAALVGATPNSIAVTLHRVRNRLREELAAYRGGSR